MKIMEKTMVKTKHWFEIDEDGWKRMNVGRDAGHLIREGISNVFDVEGITEAKITLEPGHIIIEDNGQSGFENPELVFTVFMTDKEDSCTKRGRKGRGLKELLSAANKAVVETIGFTIVLDENGRTEEKNTRTQGTKVEIWTDLENWQELDTAIEYLKMIIPPNGVRFILNGEKIQTPKKINTIEIEYLRTTTIVNGVQKDFDRKSEIELYEIRKVDKSQKMMGIEKNSGWLYEMGIPIQKIIAPFHINVAQRIPLNDNRDTVADWYVFNIYAKIVKTQIDSMTKANLSEDWIVSAITYFDRSVSEKYAVKLVGEKAVLKTGNKAANDTVRQHEFKLVEVENLPYNIREVLQSHIKSADVFASSIDDCKEERSVVADEVQQKFAEVVCWFGHKLLGVDVNCRFYERERDYTGFAQAARWFPALNTIEYNVLDTKHDWSKPLGAYNIEIMVHEFAHHYVHVHSNDFCCMVEKLAGRLVVLILENMDEVKSRFGVLGYRTGKTVVINCLDCGVAREIKVQDVHQVQRCKQCQKEHRNKRRSEIRRCK